MVPRSRLVAIFLLLSLLAVAAVSAWLYLLLRNPAPDAERVITTSEPPAETPALTYHPVPIGLPVEGRPIITHVTIADLDADGLLDVLVCDAAAGRIGWIRQAPRGVFIESTVGDPIAAPVRVTVGDINGDGRPDLLVASMGRLQPTNDRIGQVVVMENLGEQRFRNRVLADQIARVSDVRAADLNGDGRLDLVIGQHGLEQGEAGWMENLGNWEFRTHVLAGRSGAIAAPVADYDGNGAADIAVLFSREHPAVQLFGNGRGGEFHESVLWRAENGAWGASGLETADLNRDGLPDLLVANGDGAHAGFSEPAPWHGLQWLENRGAGFEPHRVGLMPGCYSPIATDLDADGDLDLVAVSAFNHAIDPEAVWLAAWLNDGQQSFQFVPLARDPTRFITVAAGDLDGSGVPVLVTGGFHVYPPFARMSRVTVWRQSQPGRP